MRISATQFQATMTGALQDAQSRVATLTARMASGRRLLLPSDDPLTSVRLSRLRREEATIAQYRDNIGALRSRLGTTEGHLTGLSSDLQQARDLMVAALDGSQSSDNLHAFGEQLRSIAESLFDTTNTADGEGRRVFSGTATGTAPLTYDASAAVGARYAYAGNLGTQQVVVGQDTMVPANESLPEMAALLNHLDLAATAMASSAGDVADPAARARMRDALDGIDTASASIGSRIARLGGRQNLLSTLDANHGNVSLANQQALIDLGQLDYGAAAVQLDAYDTALAASQKAYARVSRLSLFDQL